MLRSPLSFSYGWSFNNYGENPSVTPGGQVTAGGSANTESTTPLVLVTGAQLTQDCYFIEVAVHTTSGTGDRSALMDIGYDPAGGTSYTWAIENVVVGNAAALTAACGGHRFMFPLYIPAGSAVACRMQCAQASITARVAAKVYGQPTHSGNMPVGAFCETIGSVTNSSGQTFTPGNAGDGNWADLGATAKATWWWQLSYQVSNGTITAEYTYIDLAWGDASNKHIIMRAMHGGTTAELNGDLLKANRSLSAFSPVPAGANIYVRGRCVNAPDTGYNALAHGIGG